MAKAYNRVEWTYLRAVMKKLGFVERWINQVMECVESVTFLVKINGQYSKVFKPTRGIRQGEPISPYLFFTDRKSTRLNSSHITRSRMPSSA